MVVTIGGIPVFNAIISDEETGMFKISLVDDPAVMSNFQAFDNARRPMLYSIQDEEKRLVRGCVMRADFPIYRISPDMGEYYVIYRADQIRTMAEKYLAENRQNCVNLMHEEGTDVNSVQMVQYFIKGDGVNVDGFDTIADGSLFAEFHVLDDTIWNAIKDGTYKGFSLEGVFDLVPEQDIEEVKENVDELDGMFKRLFKHYKNMTKLSKFKEALAKMLQEFGNVTTDKGILAWDGDEDIKVDDAVYVEDMDGNRTPAEDGEYKTDDNKVIVVVEGKVADIKDAEVEVAPVDAPEEINEETFGTIATENGELIFEGEEIAVGVAVFVADENGENVAAPDGEYVTEDKVIVVVDGVVSEIKDKEIETPEEVAPEESEEMKSLKAENASLKAEVANLKSQIEKMSKMPLAKPAHQEFESTSNFTKTGIKGLDNLSRFLSAK